MDRFYPVGLGSDPGAWKTTYEIQNEMRSFARSAYPPGTAIHLPGARDFFGYSAPGPLRHRLSQPHLHLGEELDVTNPRENHAIPRIQVPDDRHTFMSHDTQDMAVHYTSPVAAQAFSTNPSPIFTKTRSLPALTRPSVPARTSDIPEPVCNFEDDHQQYFVPKNKCADGVAKLHPFSMSKLSKFDKISFPYTGEGTGFRTQSGQSEWAPTGSYQNVPTSYRVAFKHPTSLRLSPLGTQ